MTRKNTFVKIIVSKEARQAPRAEAGVRYEDVAFDNAMQEKGYGPDAARAMKKRNQNIVKDMMAAAIA